LIKLKEFNKSIKAVVDGHQRLGLAKRLKAQGQDVKIIAHVFKEIDNIPKEMMLVKGMLINLRNNTGTAVDAARVLRTAGKLDWEKIKQTLPLKQKLVRNADGLSRLSDDAWGLFLNRRINEDLAARIGLKIENKAIHNKLLAALSSRNFTSLQEIDTVLEQIKRTPTVKSEQETLFGKEFFEETLIFEKTALIKYVSQNSKKLKDVFKTVLANEKDLSSAGNVLNKSENLQRGIDNEKIYERLSAVATQTGRLSDDFNNAAAFYKQGNKQEARRLAEEAVRRAVAEGDFDRFSAGGLQRTNEIETASSSISKEPPIEKVDLTEDLKHKDIKENPQVVEQQIDDLNNNLFGEDLPQTRARTQIDLEEERLVDEIKNAEPTIENANKFLNHPLLKRKIEENNKFIQRTSERPNFNTPEYFATRDYGNLGVGLENFIQKFYGSGSAIKNKELVIVMGPTAAGKSTFVERVKRDLGAFVADSDDVKKLMPEYQNGANADGVHFESSIINARILVRAMNNGDNIIYPTTGRSVEKLNKVIKNAEIKGYTVKVQLITADRPDLILRNITRTFTKNRVIDSNELLSENVVNGIEKNYINLDEKYKIGQINNSKREFQSSDFDGLRPSRQVVYSSDGQELRVEGYSEDIVSRVSPDDKVPDQTIINTETGELENTMITVRELLERERQDETFLARLKDCT
jgi:predicted ABC-type ATPase